MRGAERELEYTLNRAVPVGFLVGHPDKARRRRTIAYLLITLLALVVTGLPTMVVFGVAVGDVKEFGVILGPLVTLVTAATSFYYGTKPRGFTATLNAATNHSLRPASRAGRSMEGNVSRGTERPKEEPGDDSARRHVIEPSAAKAVLER